jgi:ABC-2 type transport system ATP-binding protein
MDDIIQVQGVTKNYGSFTAVDDISFSVKKGEVFGILGPNGAGKTTTLEMIEGLRLITKGTILVDGIDVAKETNKVKSIIGVQLQSTGFFENLTLVELLYTYAALYDIKINPMEILHEVELEEKSKQQVKTLSGGQQQRFSIALALANDPLVLFLDEPTTGLDPQARRHLWKLVQQIQAKGKTIVLTTHYMEEAEELCARIAVMDHGHILKLATPDQMIDDLIATGFRRKRIEKEANLEDVFLDLTGHQLREDK